MAKWTFVQNDFIEEGKTMIHFRDLSFQRGYGIFDFFRLIGHTPLFLNDHLDRFYSSAERMHLIVPYPRTELKKLIFELIRKNDLPGTGIRLGLTGGYSEDGFSLGNPLLLISQHHLPLPTKEQIKKGISLMTYPYQRQLPHVKTIDYLMAIWLQPTRIQQKFDDILYHNNGFITECPRSNFFLIDRDDTIVTPSENILYGITRKKLIELAGENCKVKERPIRLEELSTAKEAFITSTTKQILPVSKIDDIIFKEPKSCNKLLNLFQTFSAKEADYVGSASKPALRT